MTEKAWKDEHERLLTFTHSDNANKEKYGSLIKQLHAQCALKKSVSGYN